MERLSRPFARTLFLLAPALCMPAAAQAQRPLQEVEPCRLFTPGDLYFIRTSGAPAERGVFQHDPDGASAGKLFPSGTRIEFAADGRLLIAEPQGILALDAFGRSELLIPAAELPASVERIMVDAQGWIYVVQGPPFSVLPEVILRFAADGSGRTVVSDPLTGIETLAVGPTGELFVGCLEEPLAGTNHLYVVDASGQASPFDTFIGGDYVLRLFFRHNGDMYAIVNNQFAPKRNLVRYTGGDPGTRTLIALLPGTSNVTLYDPTEDRLLHHRMGLVSPGVFAGFVYAVDAVTGAWVEISLAEPPFASDAAVFGGSGAAVELRNGGTNPTSYAASHALTGRELVAHVDLSTTGHSMALVRGYDTPVQVLLPGGQTLLASDGGGGELFATPAVSGPVAEFRYAFPADPGLIGLRLYTQALHFGGQPDFALSNAQDLTVGYGGVGGL